MPWKRTRAFGHSAVPVSVCEIERGPRHRNDDVDFHPLVLVDQQGQEILLESTVSKPMSVECFSEELKS